jgi:hypothetical protein
MISKILPYMFRTTTLALLLVLTFPQLSLAADVLIAPPLLDLELQARDVVTKDITVKNQTQGKIYVYATVNEIAVDDSGDIKEFISPVMDNRETAITSWIEISRGRIELMPDEEKVVPLTVRVHPYAESGEYHAFIGMSVEANRPLAEAKTMRGDADGVILKVNLADKSSDALRIVSYLIDRFVITESKRIVSLEIKNEGSKASVPKGEIVFYNSRSEEIAATSINSAGESLEPGATKLFTEKIPFGNKLGRFKANATVLYGAEGKLSVFDTAQFYMIPYKLLILFVIIIILFSLLVTYLLRRVFYDELHSDDREGDIPLYVRKDREHTEHDHDIHLKKN